ncbi:helix-turn-helix transcriptional regulator [Amycolatopsis sp. DG1A-15b]|uniref:helix-turn-helix domain-containing protein n=1 Tax=Amycolatopsis sp. DG1A-15b TaxID=3052846 RepID=UPI00255B4AA0|nr:helix-turn-helix transcriptional regulator [Amycolatopsis sp. DG1A-15b]WIX90725.1 helix-turn-helix transcriptional regulator [Amycolatopsis sp. DG1A-15b]
MTKAHSPVASQRRVLAEMKEAREALQLTQKEVAEALDWSVSKLIRIEGGTVGLSITDLKALLLHYGITDRDRVEKYVAMAKAGREPGWWDQYKRTNSPEFVKFLGLESAAVVLRQYQLLVVPGLLQIPAYTSSLALTASGKPELADLHVRLRRDRQQRLADPDLENFFILDESVLHRRITDADVWRQQLQHLRDIALQPNVTLRVLPYKAGWVRGMQSSFELLQLSEQSNDLFLDVEQPDGDQFFDDVTGAVKAAEFIQLFFGLEEAAHSADETPELIDRMLERLDD